MVMRSRQIGKRYLASLMNTIMVVWLKLEIYGQSIPRKWCGYTPHHYNFQFIGLDESPTSRIANPSPSGTPIPWGYCAYPSPWFLNGTPAVVLGFSLL
ncbi:hypothetical protein AVEN_80029-1 [Araneus ventricosus]|uniref:Uncharacterized protein n=1 Tax=Araneus ventricosus TaxID=182803 RepID=A0A4Y2FPV4_ARAVE|nr:hypothetical protein AVEN_80029-1 [Araneus ventricosus]